MSLLCHMIASYINEEDQYQATREYYKNTLILHLKIYAFSFDRQIYRESDRQTSSTVFPGHRQAAGLQVEKPGHEPTPRWDDSSTTQSIDLLCHGTRPKCLFLKETETPNFPEMHWFSSISTVQGENILESIFILIFSSKMLVEKFEKSK